MVTGATNEPTEKTEGTDIVKKIIGSFGKYHLWIIFLIYINKFPVAFHQMAIIFLAPKVSYICPDTGEQTCPCNDPVYDTSMFNKTIIMEWDLICENSWLRDFTQTLFQLGVLLGSVFFGMASDRWACYFLFITNFKLINLIVIFMDLMIIWIFIYQKCGSLVAKWFYSLLRSLLCREKT